MGGKGIDGNCNKQCKKGGKDGGKGNTGDEKTSPGVEKETECFYCQRGPPQGFAYTWMKDLEIAQQRGSPLAAVGDSG